MRGAAERRPEEKVRVDIQGVLAEPETILLPFHMCDGTLAF